MAPMHNTLSGAFLGLALLAASCGAPGPQQVDTEGADPRVVQARGTLAESEQATIAIFQSAAPSVVLVISGDPNGFGDVGAGTGFVWDEAGHIVTNNHVVQGARTVIRLPTGEDIPAEVIGRAPQYDVAVLRLEHPAGAAPLPIGTS